MSDTARNIRLPDDPCGKHFASAAIVAGVWRESVAGEVNTVSGEPAFDRILGLPAPSAEEVARNKKVVARLADEVPDTGSDRWASGWCRITINQCHCSFRAALEFLREGGDAADHKAEMAGWLTEWEPRIVRWATIMWAGHADALRRANAERPRGSRKIRELLTPEQALVEALLAGVNDLKDLVDHPPLSLGEEVDLAKRYPALLTPKSSRKAERLHPGAVEAERNFAFTGPRGLLFRKSGLDEAQTIAMIPCDWRQPQLGLRRAGALCGCSKDTVARRLAEARRRCAATRLDPESAPTGTPTTPRSISNSPASSLRVGCSERPDRRPQAARRHEAIHTRRGHLEEGRGQRRRP